MAGPLRALFTRAQTQCNSLQIGHGCNDRGNANESALDFMFAGNPRPARFARGSERQNPTRLRDGDNNLELELQGAISELKRGWQPAELTPFRELIATCIANRDGKLEALGKGRWAA